MAWSLSLPELAVLAAGDCSWRHNAFFSAESPAQETAVEMFRLSKSGGTSLSALSGMWAGTEKPLPRVSSYR